MTVLAALGDVLAHSRHNASEDAFTRANALATLLTTESLLFAALTLSFSLSASQKFVRDLPISPFRLGLLATSGLCVVALGAGAAWWSIYAAGWPSSSVVVLLESVGLAAGILIQPALAALMVRGVRAKE